MLSVHTPCLGIIDTEDQGIARISEFNLIAEEIVVHVAADGIRCGNSAFRIAFAQRFPVMGFQPVISVSQLVFPVFVKLPVIRQGPHAGFIPSVVWPDIDQVLAVVLGIHPIILEGNRMVRRQVIGQFDAIALRICMTRPAAAVPVFVVAPFIRIVVGIIREFSFTALGVHVVYLFAETAAGDIDDCGCLVDFAGNDIDDTAFGTAAVNSAGSPAQHFDPFDIIHVVQQEGINVSRAAYILEIRHAHAIHQDDDVLTAIQADTGQVAVHAVLPVVEELYARYGAKGFFDGSHMHLFNFLAAHHADVRMGIRQRFFRTACRHHNRCQVIARLVQACFCIAAVFHSRIGHGFCLRSFAAAIDRTGCFCRNHFRCCQQVGRHSRIAGRCCSGCCRRRGTRRPASCSCLRLLFR